MKKKLVKSYLNKNFCLWLKLKTFVFDTSFENKTPSEELQDYKVKSVFETKRLQDYICLKGRVTGLQESFQRREGYLLSGILDLNFGPLTWTLILDLIFVFWVYLFIDEINHGKSSKVTWVSIVNSS